MRFSTLPEWLAWLESCHPTDIELGLDRIAEVAGRLGLDLSSSTVVSVAGTNGKGSCVAAVNALCLRAGRRVGCYTSPHFLQYNERIVIDGEPVTDDVLISAFHRIDQVLAGVSLTYFEFGTLAALDIFQRAALDVIVLEVGLGGRLDAVNLVDADISVVTTVALDHQDWLGADRESIAVEKAGIYRAGRPAICADDAPPRRLLDHAEAIDARLLLIHRDFDLVVDAAAIDGQMQWWSRGDAAAAIMLADVNKLALPVPSVAAALQVAELLGIAQRHWSCLSALGLPGRFQQLRCGGKQLLLDVAHNPAAANWLAEKLASQPTAGKRYALFAVMADKDIEHIIEPLRDAFAEWWVTSIPGLARAATPDSLVSALCSQVSVPVIASNNVAAAITQLLPRLDAEDELVVFGSFFTVAAAMAWRHHYGQ